MSLSTIFSVASDRGKAKPRKRSESVSAMARVSKNRREPSANYSPDYDVSTLICTEISRAIMLVPNVNLGSFFGMANDARRDINKSDTTILVTAAVLASIGNKEMSKRLLDKSSTLTKIYERMGLNSDEIRNILVTMLFALSPGFVQMIEKVIKLTVDRSSKRGTEKKDDDPMVTALARLTIDNTISPSELRKASSFDVEKEPSFALEAGRTSIQNTPVSLISADDFYKEAEKAKKDRHRISEKDLMSYSVRRHSGDESEFSEVFRSAQEPVAVRSVANSRKTYDRRGLGYTSANRVHPDYISAMNKIIGSHNTKSIDINTGEVSYRKPNVQDFHDSESVSASVYDRPPDVGSEYAPFPAKLVVKKPLPSDLFLPDDIASKVDDDSKTVKKVDSFEMLLREAGYS